MPFFRKFRIIPISESLSLIIACWLLVVGVQAQHTPDFMLQATLKTSAPDRMIHLAARGNEQLLIPEIKKRGGNILHQLPGLIYFRIPAGAVADFSKSPGLDFLEFNGGRGHALNDTMLYNNRVIAVHDSLAWPGISLTGKDVVVGLVDTGIELAHPDFQHADGSTRIRFLWDQNQNGTPPELYNYGAEWTAEDINAGITGHQDQPVYFGHGSTVTGTAAGNGLATGNFKGVAPKADLIIVSSDFGSPNWTMTVAEGVKYIFEKADELGKPAVVNLSLGSYSGSHDGLDAAALLIDSLINAQPGRAVVCAVGNSGNWPPYHLGYEVTADTNFSWFQYNANSALGYGAVFFELWADTADFKEVRFAVGADQVTPSVQFRGATAFRQVEDIVGEIVSDTLFAGENQIAVVDYLVGIRGGQYRLQVHLATPDSAQYRFRWITTGTGKFDVWSSAFLGTSNIIATGLPSEEELPEIIHYKAPDKFKHMVSSWAASPHVIAVGNYNNRDQYIDYNGNLQEFDPPAGQLSVNSSWGPTRDERLKPEVSASGDLTLSAGKLSVLAAMIANEPHKVAPGGMHYRNGGTSMASPVVSGAAALILEQCPYATIETIREAIINNVYFDEFSGDSPDPGYGYGKIDVAAAVASLYFQPGFTEDLEIHLCDGDSVELELTEEYMSYEWSTGSESNSMWVEAPGAYAVEVIDGNGCRGRSDTVVVWVHENPLVTIELHFDTLVAMADSTLNFQWLQDGVPVDGATNDFLIPDSDGLFSVQVSDSNNCTGVSNEIEYIISSATVVQARNFSLYPVPARDRVFIESSGPVEEISIWSADGKQMKQISRNATDSGLIEIKTDSWPAGIYLIRLKTDRWISAARLILE